MIFMCTGAGILAFSVFGAGTAAGSIIVSLIYGFFSGGYVSLIGPALISMATHPSEIGIRMGMGKWHVVRRIELMSRILGYFLRCPDRNTYHWSIVG
jgi:hypothetical protein